MGSRSDACSAVRKKKGLRRRFFQGLEQGVGGLRVHGPGVGNNHGPHFCLVGPEGHLFDQLPNAADFDGISFRRDSDHVRMGACGNGPADSAGTTKGKPAVAGNGHRQGLFLDGGKAVARHGKTHGGAAFSNAVNAGKEKCVGNIASGKNAGKGPQGLFLIHQRIKSRHVPSR